MVSRIPDAPGGIRFCLACDKWIPVIEFPRGTRRHCCKRHSWANSGRKARARQLADTNKRILFRLWGKCYSDSARFSFAWRASEDSACQPNTRKSRVAITQAEVEQMLTFGAADYSSKEVSENPVQFAKSLAIVPVDCDKIISLCNAALVSNCVKRKLFLDWKIGGCQMYSESLREAHMHTKNAFIPTQDQLNLMRSKLNCVLESTGVQDSCMLQS